MFWIDRFVSEKELDTEHTFEVEGAGGPNFIPLAVVIEHIKIATKQEQAQIKNILVKVDFVNGNVMRFFEHLAKAIAMARETEKLSKTFNSLADAFPGLVERRALL